MTSRADVDINILLDLSSRQLLRQCEQNPEIEYICRSKKFWRMKIEREFPNIRYDLTKPLHEYKRLKWLSGLSDECKQFHESPLRNPYTKRPISPSGEMYRRLVQECGDPSTKTYDSYCDEFHRTPTIDPITRKHIPLFGTQYKKLVTDCNYPPVHKGLTDCQKFNLNSTVNPTSGQTISPGGPVHQRLMRDCRQNECTIV